MPEMREVPLHHDGTDLVGALFLPEGAGPHPGVLVMHNAHGMGDFVRERARKLAARGYAAIATDMYGSGRYYPDPGDPACPARILFAEPALLRNRVVEWHKTLTLLPEVDATRTAAIGFCFGGRCVLELARSGADVRAVVSYHGLLGTAARAEHGAVKAEVVVFTGGQDPYAPREDVDAIVAEMAAAGARLDLMVFSDAAHAFTDPEAALNSGGRPGIAYDGIADAISWGGTIALLARILDAPTEI